MELFDTLAIMFESPHRWGEISNYDKRKHFFMINRMMSIQYPLHANMLQNLKVNQIDVVNFWFSFISKQYNRKPSWLYTKTNKKKKTTAPKKSKKEKMKEVTEDDIIIYTKKYKYDIRDVRLALELYGDEVKTEILNLKEILNT